MPEPDVIVDEMCLCVVYDVKARRFGDVAMFDSPEAAIRSFGDLLADDRTALGRHPEDYKLFHLGNYDKYHGRIDGFVSPTVLCNGFDFELGKREVK